jgi:hypothetical protein
MFKILTLLFIIFCATQVTACNKFTANEKIEESPEAIWWHTVEPIVIGSSEFYGSTCSVLEVTKLNDGTISQRTIFSAPSKFLTYCAKNKPGRNYLEYDGEYIILNVNRQTAGSGSWTAERYRSANFSAWQEYIGVTWREGEQYEAWRNVGSTSSKADSRKKVVRSSE